MAETKITARCGGVAVLLLVLLGVACRGADEAGLEPKATASGHHPVVSAAGDIATGGGKQAATAKLLAGADYVLTLGDNAYPDGTLAQFLSHYKPSWGIYKAKTKPAPGNHDWNTLGAEGYEAYFGLPERHWYSWNLGNWHLIALDSNCSDVGGCRPGSPQYEWLRRDLAANSRPCILAYWHHPRFSSGRHGGTMTVAPFWDLLYRHAAEIVLSGHDHNYQRWARQRPDGTASAGGIRQFVVGTGGAHHYPAQPARNLQAFNTRTWGVLNLTLQPGGYTWRFRPIAGQSFTDTGQNPCN